MGDWPDDPYGDMVPLLRASVEDAKRRHPSGKGNVMEGVQEEIEVCLTAADRCDMCSAAAQFRMQMQLLDPDSWRMGLDGDLEPVPRPTLDFCGHHYVKNSIMLSSSGWNVTGIS